MSGDTVGGKIIEGLVESVDMAKLMKENAQLRTALDHAQTRLAICANRMEGCNETHTHPLGPHELIEEVYAWAAEARAALSVIEPPVADEIYCAVCNENMAPETDWHTECGRDDCPHFKPSVSERPKSSES